MLEPRVAPSKESIMVVDDDPAGLRLLTQILQQRGYKTRPVPDGGHALRAARSTPPDLILLDIKMPDMSGYEVCAQLKADDRTRGVPVIFISALDALEDKIKAFTAGGVDYITKPIQDEEVLARVETHLTLWRLQRELQDKNAQLQAALDEVKVLKGILPICASCKKIRDDEGYWQDVADYIRDHSEAEFTHGLCPDCLRRLYPDFAD